MSEKEKSDIKKLLLGFIVVFTLLNAVITFSARIIEPFFEKVKMEEDVRHNIESIDELERTTTQHSKEIQANELKIKKQEVLEQKIDNLADKLEKNIKALNRIQK